MTNRTYTATERQEAVALALSIGQRKAAHQLNIPQRTLSSWQTGMRHPEVAPPVVLATNKVVAERLWQVIDDGAAELLARISDPKARLGDVARALEIALQAHQLITGGVTSRSENLNLNASVDPLRKFTEVERDQLVAFLREVAAMTDDELRAAAPEILPAIADADRLADAYQAGDPEAVRLLTEPVEDTDGLG